LNSKKRLLFAPLTPRNLHISVNHGTIHNVDALLKDLRQCVKVVRQSTPIDAEGIRAMVSAVLQSPDLPSEMTFINEVLDALPDALCNEFLVNFFNDLYV
jgi:hypothetical protein